jgi:hypothetical protein
MSSGILNPVREGIWTESIAVGGQAFLREIASRNKIRKRLKITRTGMAPGT